MPVVDELHNPTPSDLGGTPSSTAFSGVLKHDNGADVGFSHFTASDHCFQLVHVAGFEHNRPYTASDLRSRLKRIKISVACFHERRFVGHLCLRPYGIADNGHLVRTGIWAASGVTVHRNWCRRGVATALYAHIKSFNYPISPAPVLTSQGIELWRQLDPCMRFDNNYPSLKIERQPPILLQPGHVTNDNVQTMEDPFLPERVYPARLSMEDTIGRSPQVRMFLDELQRHYVDPLEVCEEALKSGVPTLYSKTFRRAPHKLGRLRYDQRPTDFLVRLLGNRKLARLSDLYDQAFLSYHDILGSERTAYENWRDGLRDKLDSEFTKWLQFHPPAKWKVSPGALLDDRWAHTWQMDLDPDLN